MGCLIFTCLFPQKSHISSGSFCGKRRANLRYHMHLCHPVPHSYVSHVVRYIGLYVPTDFFPELCHTSHVEESCHMSKACVTHTCVTWDMRCVHRGRSAYVVTFMRASWHVCVHARVESKGLTTCARRNSACVFCKFCPGILISPKYILELGFSQINLIKSNDIWRYRKHTFCVLSFHL